MGCCGEDAVQVSKMALELKSGQMLYHKRRIFGKNWREVHAVLYNDSTLAWYKDKGQTDQEGGVIIKNAPELIAFGQYTNMIPNRPELPDTYSDIQLLAFGTRGKENVHWFLCPSEQEVENWMTAIGHTLPPPPKPFQPQEQQQQQEPPPQPSIELPPDPQPAYNTVVQPPTAPQPPNLQPPPPPPYMPHPDPMRIPGQYPTPTSFRPQYPGGAPLQPAYQQQQYNVPVRTVPANPGGANTTVVVQDRRNDGGGDFAMGMLVGGAVGTTVGYGLGHGWGWGHGHGYGWGGGGGWHSGPTVHDTDVTINNYYDVDNTVVNNDIDVDASQDIMMADDVIGGDYDAVDLGGDFDVGF